MQDPSPHSLPSDSSPKLDAENPWAGFLSYGEEDWPYFHGREQATEKLCRLVRRGRFTLLFGQSGVGKTSLLQAGLVHNLKAGGEFLPVYIELDHSESAPALIEQIHGAITDRARAASVEAPKPRPGETLWELFHRRDADFWNERNRLVVPVLIFDQFERFFTRGKSNPDRAGRTFSFLTELGDLIEGRIPDSVTDRLESFPEEEGGFLLNRHAYKIVLGLQQDYLPEFLALDSRIPSIIHNHMPLGPLDGEQALRAVALPGHALLDNRVDELIVRFVAKAEGTAATVPLAALEVDPTLLSVVCEELNDKRRQKGLDKITAQLVEQDQAKVLKDIYESRIKGFPSSVRIFIENNLLTKKGNARDSVARQNLPDEMETALPALIQKRLLRVEERYGVERVELTHDLLISVIRESRDSRQQQEAEAAQRKAEDDASLARRDLRRIRWLTAALALLAILAGSAWYRELRATRKQQEAEAERNRALTEARRAGQRVQGVLAASDLKEAVGLIGGERLSESLPYLARVLRSQPDNELARRAALHLMLYGRWHLPRALLPHSRTVLEGQWSRSGKWLATGTEDGIAQIWEARSGLRAGPPLHHDDNDRVLSLDFSADERYLVSAVSTAAYLWDRATGRRLGKLQHERPVRAVRFSPTASVVATASEDGKARLWDAATGQVLHTLQHPKPSRPTRGGNSVYSVRFSRDGRHVATACWNQEAYVWDVQTGKRLSRLAPHPGWVFSAELSPDGRMVVTTAGAESQAQAQVWDAATGRKIGPAIRHRDRLAAALFSPDGKKIVTASWDGEIFVWQVGSGRRIAGPMRHQGPVSSAEISPDGRWILTASTDGTARVWDAATGDALGEPLRHQDRVTQALFSPDGQGILTLSGDRTARIWSARSQSALPVAIHAGSPIRSADILPQGGRLLVAAGTAAQIWDIATAKPEESLDHTAPVLGASLSADGRIVTAAFQDGAVRALDLPTRQKRPPLQLGGRVDFVRVDAKGRRVLSVSGRQSQVWDSVTGRPVGEATVETAPVVAADISPDGQWFVTSSGNGVVHIRDAQSGKDRCPAIRRHDGVVSIVRFSLDGETLLTASEDSTARLWNASTGSAVTRMNHRRQVLAAEISADGENVATASEDATARLWESRSGYYKTKPLRHGGPVVSVDFSSDRRQLVTGSQDKTARVWSVETGQAITPPFLHPAAVLSVRFSPDGERIVTVADDGIARVWDVPTSSPQDAAILAQLSEVASGYKIGDTGAVEPLDPGSCRRALEMLLRRAPARGSLAASVARWFLADPQARTISPFSRITLAKAQ